jgi:hypothetical protein
MKLLLSAMVGFHEGPEMIVREIAPTIEKNIKGLREAILECRKYINTYKINKNTWSGGHLYREENNKKSIKLEYNYVMEHSK